MDTTVEQLLQMHENDTIIAHPGEPIVNIDASAARQKVNRYVGGEISLMMRGVEPALVYSKERLLWRVPIEFASPMRGRIGLLGALDVDARTGNLLISINFAEEIEANARAILKHSPYSAESCLCSCTA
jgi:hypothetical protein